MTKSALLIEDDPDIVDLLRIHLHDLDFKVESADNGIAGLDKGLNQNFDFIVLDLMLPAMDGLEVCRRLRAQAIHTPILMLTAKSEEIDRVLGLELGADDYLTKPFSVREFIARVKAISRRTGTLQTAQTDKHHKTILRFGDLIIDLDKRKVTLAEKRIDVSPKEFELLSLLASSPGKSYDRSRILNLVWGYDFDGYEHTVNSHINRLRGKIEPNIHQPKYILTSWGVGYRFNEDL